MEEEKQSLLNCIVNCINLGDFEPKFTIKIFQKFINNGLLQVYDIIYKDSKIESLEQVGWVGNNDFDITNDGHKKILEKIGSRLKINIRIVDNKNKEILEFKNKPNILDIKYENNKYITIKEEFNISNVMRSTFVTNYATGYDNNNSKLSSSSIKSPLVVSTKLPISGTKDISNSNSGSSNSGSSNSGSSSSGSSNSGSSNSGSSSSASSKSFNVSSLSSAINASSCSSSSSIPKKNYGPFYIDTVNNDKLTELATKLEYKSYPINPELLEDFIRIPITGDGNCLFNVLSIFMSGDESKNQELRKDVCDYMENNQAIFNDEKNIVSNMVYIKDTSNGFMKKYITKMREDKVWATNIELLILSLLFGRQIIVIMGHGKEDQKYHTKASVENILVSINLNNKDNCNLIVDCYRVLDNNIPIYIHNPTVHYELLVPKNKDDNKLPEKKYNVSWYKEYLKQQKIDMEKEQTEQKKKNKKIVDEWLKRVRDINNITNKDLDNLKNVSKEELQEILKDIGIDLTKVNQPKEDKLINKPINKPINKSIACKICTFENKLDSSKCKLCDTKLNKKYNSISTEVCKQNCNHCKNKYLKYKSKYLTLKSN